MTDGMTNSQMDMEKTISLRPKRGWGGGESFIKFSIDWLLSYGSGLT